MKKLILVAVLLLSISALSFAQSTTANISASVSATISITRLTDLAIGAVAQGATKSIASNVAAAASFQIVGAASQTSTLTVTVPSSLVSGSYSMPFTGAVPNYHNVAGAAGSTACTGTGPYSTGVSDGSGNLWVYIGGSVTADAGQASGSYSGTMTIAVAQP